MIRLVIHGKVVAKKNSKAIYRNRRTGKPFIASNPRVKDWMRSATEQLQTAWSAEPLDYPVGVRVVVYQGRGQRIDLDNAVSSVFDALQNGGVLRNDYLIEEVHAYRRRDRERPRVEIGIYPENLPQTQPRTHEV